MYPLFLTSLGVCFLSSCSMSDWQTKTPSSTTPPSNIQSSISEQVTDTTRETLILAYEEELLAHDVYTFMVSKYPELSGVNNIIQSEAEHQESVGRLLDARGITRPTDYGAYRSTYDTLIAKINTSRNDAIEVGIMIETGDIDHLLEEYKKFTDTDIRRVFERIGGASYNHLRSFLNLAKTYNYTPVTDWMKYLNEVEASQSGPLQYKMTELLKANNLPTSGNTQGMGKGKQGMNGGRRLGHMNR